LHALVLTLVLGGAVVVLVRNASAGTHRIADRQLMAELQSFEAAALQRPAGQALAGFAEAYLRSHAVPSGDNVVIGGPGIGIVASAGSQRILDDPAVSAKLAEPGGRTQIVSARLDGRDSRVLVAPLEGGGASAGTFVATADLSGFAGQERRVFVLSSLEAALALFVGVLSAYLLLRRLLRTIGRITDKAEDIGEQDLGQRIGVLGTDDELAQLAERLDAMLDRVQVSHDAQRRLLSDVSHQLRTPLTVVRGHLEVLLRTGTDDPTEVRDTVELVVNQLEDMRSLVERLLLLGHAMEPGSLTVEPIDLRTFLRDLWEASRVIAPRRFELGPVPDVVVEADVGMLRGAVLNLLDNAVKATEPGDVVALGARLQDSGVSIEVADAGPGISADQRSAVLDRFARPGARRAGGSGLGLAIVRAVAEAHGGRVGIRTSPLGGALVSLWLPPGAIATAGASDVEPRWAGVKA
jgi:signal transduction histidine kinase